MRDTPAGDRGHPEDSAEPGRRDARGPRASSGGHRPRGEAGEGPARRDRSALRMPHADRAERPFLVIWEATQACPLACRHCRAEARPHRDPAELSTAEAVDLMRQVAAFGRPAPLFVITGGDPFARPDLFELVAAGSELGLAVSVSPSGTPTLTRTALRRLYDAGARAISLSLDAASAAGHDGFRGVDGVYRLTLDAWEHALDLGLKVQINTTVSRTTVSDLPALAAMVRDRGALLWSLFPLVPTGRGRSLAALAAGELEDVLNALYDIGATIPVKTTEGHHFKRVWQQRQVLAGYGADPVEVLGLGTLYARLRRELDAAGLLAGHRARRPPMRVSSANGFVFVSHRGEVHPSGFLPLSAGSVRRGTVPPGSGLPGSGLPGSGRCGSVSPGSALPGSAVPGLPGAPAGSATVPDGADAVDRPGGRDAGVAGTGGDDPAGLAPLVAIYRTAPLFLRLRDAGLLGGRCGRCEFREVCGGSRARAYAATGDELAQDPACGYRPGSFPYPLDPVPSGGSNR